MCDTVAVVDATGVWLAKNSDREPTEVQLVERHAAADHLPSAAVRCTYLKVPQVGRTHELLISRPHWMWGCEMGVNEHGVAIGNEAVFTKLSVPAIGLTGMDLVRLALERASSAGDALEVITDLLARYAQGGRMGYRQRSFRYHSSFLIADPGDAWVLETAGSCWVAERVRGIRTISNVLTIGRDFDRIGPGTYETARAQGWCHSADDFHFAACFGRRFYQVVTGGEQRRECTREALIGPASLEGMMRVLRDHGGRPPTAGWRAEAPCAHATWLPTRSVAHTTGSMIVRLESDGPQAWFTGTSTPCLSVFKPVPFGHEVVSLLPQPGPRCDGDSLWWRHSRLHRTVLADYPARAAVFAEPRLALERRGMTDGSPEVAAALWREHRELVPEWTARATQVGHWRPTPTQLFWEAQALRASMW